MRLVLRSEKGSRLEVNELDGNFSYLLSEIVRVEGLTDGSSSVKIVRQELSTSAQQQVRENIAAIDVKLAGLPTTLTASEKEMIREKLGVVAPEPVMATFKHMEVSENEQEFLIEGYSRVIIDYYTTAWIRCALMDGNFEGQEVVIRSGVFDGSAAMVKIVANVWLSNGTSTNEIQLSTDSIVRLVWTLNGWVVIN